MQAFELSSSHHVPVLQATIEQYVDPVSGARHIHMANDDAEIAFLVAFPTVPDASDGRAHILEHLALAGSERFPVRSPFFSMLRRSTATFMNAMTYADRTAYPFATTDRQDFFNLLDVYLDASFFPQLSYLDFLQEGWRHVFDGGKLAYQGVVFNEMKGAIADPMYALHHGIIAPLFAGTTYEVASGGDPLAIPELSHAMLRDFHASHYHPSQAVFMSAGRIDAASIQERIASQVLARRSGQAPRRTPALAGSWSAPREQDLRIPSQQAKDDEHGLQLAWLLGEMTDTMGYYEAHLLAAGLLNDSAAPLRAAMESSGFGRPSRLNGQDTNMRQMVFHAGMEGLTLEQVGPAHDLILAALERAALEGVPEATLRAALRDLRYQQRNTEGGGTPFMLRRMLQALPLALYGGDVMHAFDNEAALAQLDTRIKDPAFFKTLVRALLDNPTRLTTRVMPDADYFTARAATEQLRLANLEAQLSAAERARIEADSAALAAHQALPVDKTLLPRIRPGDVSPQPRPVPAVPLLLDGALSFDVPTNGISYARLLVDVSHVAPADWPWLDLYADLLPDLGVGELDYAAADAWRQALVPSFRVGLDQSLTQDGGLRLELVYSSSALREEHAAIAEVLATSIKGARFDETARLAFLIERLVQSKFTGLAKAGRDYALLAAGAPLSPLRHFQNAISGVPSLPFYGALQTLAQTADGLAQIAARLVAMHALVTGLEPIRLCVGAGADAAALARMLTPTPDALVAAPPAASSMGSTAPVNLALHATSQVNHCVIAWRAPRIGHPDAAALAVAAEFMGANMLHQALREQGGAYGGFASYSGDAGMFSMSSFRDPRLAGTYADFNAALAAVENDAFSAEQLEEAIISVIKGLDKPMSPYVSAVRAWQLQRSGIDEAVRQQFRTGILTCTLDQIRAAVRTWLVPASASRVAFVGDSSVDLAGLALVDLTALTTPAA
ncbi:insulinase family protein [Massilia sp. S19_KUP03_FR1]|uniref:insulinase family protein n=1 Tax=Massilia sp. S19_KUP03_FR1 TaxID=3025503 RepID=UPI002FCDA16E